KLNTTTQQDAGALRDPAPPRCFDPTPEHGGQASGQVGAGHQRACPDEPHRAPAREPYSATVEPRTTSWHGSVCTPWERLPSIASKMARAARRPRALKFMSTLVNCGRAPVARI